MKKLSKILIVLLIGFLLMQLFRPKELSYSAPTNATTKDLSNLPKEVTTILKNSCFNCHSNEVELSWYDKITPINYLVNQHIQDGRKALNFSNWDDLEKGKQNATLFYSFNKILSGEMPLRSYTLAHPQAVIDEQQLETIKTYLNKIAKQKNLTIEENKNTEKKNNPLSGLTNSKKILNVEKSLNGISYLPNYKNWKAISFSDRFDNGTMRIIYGNKTAENAIKTGNTSPWPDGTVFAKTAWKQKKNTDGSLTPGDFVQVEFMIKDSKKYVDSKGWGWARWKGDKLKPYGETKELAQECIQCHLPAKSNDYVFTAPLQLNFTPIKITNKAKK